MRGWSSMAVHLSTHGEILAQAWRSTHDSEGLNTRTSTREMKEKDVLARANYSRHNTQHFIHKQALGK